MGVEGFSLPTWRSSECLISGSELTFQNFSASRRRGARAPRYHKTHARSHRSNSISIRYTEILKSLLATPFTTCIRTIDLTFTTKLTLEVKVRFLSASSRQKFWTVYYLYNNKADFYYKTHARSQSNNCVSIR